MLDNGECELVEKNSKLSKLCEKLHKTEAKLEELMHEYDCGIKDLQMNFEEKCRENRNLVRRLACLEKVCGLIHWLFFSQNDCLHSIITKFCFARNLRIHVQH